MDSAVHAFNDELQSLLSSKLPVSKGKMVLITKAAMRGVKFYKHIVQIVEKFIARARPEYKVPGLYVVDSIVRQSRHQFGPERDVYAARFARNLGNTFENLFTDCSEEDRSRMVRVLNLWLKNGVFDSQTIRPLLDLADPNKAPSFSRNPKSPGSSETNGSTVRRDYPGRYTEHVSDKSSKFSKNMLDFDYGEEEDETPTEAEPPLSSTLNKIEMEQRTKQSLNQEKNIDIRRSSSRDTNPPSTRQSSQSRSSATKQPNVQPSVPKQDPVLERWNRIIKGELTHEQIPPHTADYQVTQRSRSRSPPNTNKPQSHDLAIRHKPSDDSREPDVSRRKSTNETTSVHEIMIHPERMAERERRCLPKIRDQHLTVCSSTLWLGHVPKSVTEVDISDAFGEFGHINSIDLIPPRGCAYVCMDRRQDAKRALSNSKRLKLSGSHIRMAWAPGKGLKEQKKWKDFWDPDVGASFVPHTLVDINSIDFDTLEEGGVIDEDSMSEKMREKRDGPLPDPEDASKHREANPSLSYLEERNLGLPVFSQATPSTTSLPPYAIPPPPMNLGIPPPLLLAQGLMRFPPPAVAITNPTPSSSLTQPLLPHGKNNSKINSESKDQQQLSGSNERKINMVEQQLNMAQPANSINQFAPVPQTLLYGLQQPEPLIFDYQHTQPQMLHIIPNMMDPNQIAMFEGQHHNPMLMQSSLLPFTQQQLGISKADDSHVAQTNQDF